MPARPVLYPFSTSAPLSEKVAAAAAGAGYGR
jgi:epoxyqueuosine reductase QueG